MGACASAPQAPPPMKAAPSTKKKKNLEEQQGPREEAQQQQQQQKEQDFQKPHLTGDNKSPSPPPVSNGAKVPKPVPAPAPYESASPESSSVGVVQDASDPGQDTSDTGRDASDPSLATSDTGRDASDPGLATSDTGQAAEEVQSSQSSSLVNDSLSVCGTMAGQPAKSFSAREMKKMTRNFAASAKLGQGGYGPVYRGKMPEGRTVAIKILESDNGQGQREWESEVRLLGKLDHPNLVRLVGYCSEGASRDLVYEFMENGSLDQWLFSSGNEPLSWDTRMKIALQAAKGLAFLHNAPGGAIIFRDFKPANVLLDGDFNAKLSDFGMAREGPAEGMSHVSTRIIGTRGYAAPEYAQTGHLTVQTDTYTYGVVLLEIITGRPTFDPRLPTAQQDMLTWLLPFLADNPDFDKIADPRLKGEYSLKALKRALTVGVCCIKQPQQRMSMNEVVKHLEKSQGRYAKEKKDGNGSTSVEK